VNRPRELAADELEELRTTITEQLIVAREDLARKRLAHTVRAADAEVLQKRIHRLDTLLSTFLYARAVHID
jgi:hypothetical protein